MMRFGLRVRKRVYEMVDNNIEYYNINAASFVAGTQNVDMSIWRDEFESYVTDGGRILDAGCGSGRDSKAFIQHGFSVVAFDASREMCKAASKLIGQEVWQMKFQEIAFEEEFDGIWACASLLHVPYEELPNVMNKLHKALKPNGVIYVSFKYGDSKMTKGERTFSNFTETTVEKMLNEAGFKVVECGITGDVREGRGDEKWVNVIAKEA